MQKVKAMLEEIESKNKKLKENILAYQTVAKRNLEQIQFKNFLAI
jgi:hypothetical protein